MKKHLHKILFIPIVFALLSCGMFSSVSNTPTPASLPAEITDSKGVTMHLIPAGDFIMGSDNGQESANPAHKVTLPDYYMDVYEVTRARYKECVTAGVCNDSLNVPDVERYFEDANFPVSSLIWEQAKTYCEWRGARLPTEAEWEKAARGTDGRTYPWGEEYDPAYVQLSGGPHEVGTYEKGKSPYGIYDMAGNVWEWTADPLAAYPGNQGDQSYYRATDRVLRGGSWESPDPVVLSTWFRFASVTGDNSGYTGFRCAKGVTP